MPSSRSTSSAFQRSTDCASLLLALSTVRLIAPPLPPEMKSKSPIARLHRTKRGRVQAAAAYTMAPDSQRRHHERVAIDAFVRVRGAKREFVFRTRDLSRAGLFLYTKVGHLYPFQVGEELEIRALRLRRRGDAGRSGGADCPGRVAGGAALPGRLRDPDRADRRGGHRAARRPDRARGARRGSVPTASRSRSPPLPRKLFAFPPAKAGHAA